MTLAYKPDGSFDCSIESPTHKFSVWIATYNSEITIGLEYAEHRSNCHTHYTCYDDDTAGCLTDLSKTLENIFLDKLIFYHSNISGFSWTEDIVNTIHEKRNNEAIEFYTWTGEV